jgi:hypothetical protein
MWFEKGGGNRLPHFVPDYFSCGFVVLCRHAFPHAVFVFMSTKKLIWGGLFIGSTIGGMLPTLWGDDMLSTSGLLLSLVGGIVGIWAGYRIAQSLYAIPARTV